MSLLDLPGELVLNELLTNLSINDVLCLANVNRAMKTIIATFEYWRGRLSSYSDLELSSKLQAWCRAGSSLSLLLSLIESFGERLEFPVIQEFHTSLLFHGKKATTHIKKIEDLYKLQVDTDTVRFHSMNVIEQVRRSIVELKASEKPEDRMNLVMNLMPILVELSNSLTVFCYLVNSLNDEQLALFLDAAVYRWFDHRSHGKRLLYYENLYGAIMIGQRNDLVQQITREILLSSTNEYCNHYDVSILYQYATAEQEKMLHQILTSETLDSDVDKNIERLDRRAICNREQLLNHLPNANWSKLSPLLFIHRFCSPEEVLNALKRRIETKEKLKYTVSILGLWARSDGYERWAERFNTLYGPIE